MQFSASIFANVICDEKEEMVSSIIIPCFYLTSLIDWFRVLFCNIIFISDNHLFISDIISIYDC